MSDHTKQRIGRFDQLSLFCGDHCWALALADDPRVMTTGQAKALKEREAEEACRREVS